MEWETRQRLIQQYGDGPNVLEHAWNSIPEDVRHFKPTEGDWSAHEVIIHCADSETYAATRIRLLAAEPMPHIVGYDQERWVEAFDYGSQSSELTFATICAVRANTFQLIKQFQESTWRAVGTHSESGPYSAESWLTVYADHLHGHAEQIRSNHSQWQAQNQT